MSTTNFKSWKAKLRLVQGFGVILSCSTISAFAQNQALAPNPFLAHQVGSLNLAPTFTLHVFQEGTVVTPASTLPQPGTAGAVAHTNVHVFLPNALPGGAIPAAAGPAVGAPMPGFFFETPASIACLYNLVTPVAGCNPNTVSVVPSGGSKAIAIVDAFHAPNAVADLTTFSKQFGLPAPTADTFEVVFALASGTQTTTTPPVDSGWEQEISLDIEWAHAMAPNAKIILVEAATQSVDDLMGAEDLASKLVAAAGGGEVSNSWGTGETSDESSKDSHFSTQHVVYFASTGDSPGTSWPSVSANVVAVGGTSVSRDPTTGTFVGESAWYDAGGGSSAFIARPAYQNPVSAIVGAHRGVPDLSAVANSRTGVWVFDQNSGGWIVVGGTSISSPVIAGITNNAGKFRLTTEDELTQIYANPAMFLDVKQGVCGPYTGLWSAAGWDFCTGVGSPDTNNGL